MGNIVSGIWSWYSSVPSGWRYEAKSVGKTFIAACLTEVLFQWDLIGTGPMVTKAAFFAASIAIVRAGVKAVIGLIVRNLGADNEMPPWYPGDAYPQEGTHMDTEEKKPSASSASEEAAPAAAEATEAEGSAQ